MTGIEAFGIFCIGIALGIVYENIQNMVKLGQPKKQPAVIYSDEL